MTNDSNILSQIQTLGKKVLPKGSSVLLYGSRARGDNREDSDYDLVVLVDKDKQQLQDFTDYAYPFMEMGWDLGAEINPMLYTRKEWSERHFTPFYKNVEHDKIVLVWGAQTISIWVIDRHRAIVNAITIPLLRQRKNRPSDLRR